MSIPNTFINVEEDEEKNEEHEDEKETSKRKNWKRKIVSLKKDIKGCLEKQILQNKEKKALENHINKNDLQEAQRKAWESAEDIIAWLEAYQEETKRYLVYEMFLNDVLDGYSFVPDDMDAFYVVKDKESGSILELDQTFEVDLESTYYLYIQRSEI